MTNGRQVQLASKADSFILDAYSHGAPEDARQRGFKLIASCTEPSMFRHPMIRSTNSRKRRRRLRNDRAAPRGIATIAPQLRRAARCPCALRGHAPDSPGVRILRPTTGRKSSPCHRHRISRSTTPTGRPATAPRVRWWCKVRSRRHSHDCYAARCLARCRSAYHTPSRVEKNAVSSAKPSNKSWPMP